VRALLFFSLPPPFWVFVSPNLPQMEFVPKKNGSRWPPLLPPFPPSFCRIVFVGTGFSRILKNNVLLSQG